MPKSELDRAKELVDEFIARLPPTQHGSGDGQGKGPCLKQGQQEIKGLEAFRESLQKKRRGGSRKYT
jgi:hypothetical protein